MRRISATLKHLDAPVVGIALTDGGLEIYDWGRVDAERETDHRAPERRTRPDGADTDIRLDRSRPLRRRSKSCPWSSMRRGRSERARP